MNQSGYPLVLTADRILMAEYDVLLDGMLSAGLTSSTPEPAMRWFMAPPAGCDQDGRARKAPYGLRLVEGELHRLGHGRDEVIVTTPERLARVVGEDTRAILVSSGDPLGLGMNDSTMTGVAGGRPYAPLWWQRMMKRIRRLKKRFPHLRVLCGGPGAWQLARERAKAEELGVDTVFLGYAEGTLEPVLEKALKGENTPFLVEAPIRRDALPAPLPGPASMGVVEISRGCGLGCPFCTVRSHPMIHFPQERIVENARINIAGGERHLSLISEDFFRYGGDWRQLNPDALLEMLEAVRRLDGSGIFQTDHTNISSVARFPKDKLRQVNRLMKQGQSNELVWINLGIETLNGELLHRHGCGTKIQPFEVDQWERVCEQAVRDVIDAGFIPMLSFLFGIPGESAEDMERTLRFLERLDGMRLMSFPLFYAPVTADQKPFTSVDMTPAHWRVFRRSYDFNFRWVPRVYWDNQGAASTPFWKRALIQIGGKAQAWQWRYWMWSKHLRSRARYGS